MLNKICCGVTEKSSVAPQNGLSQLDCELGAEEMAML